MDSIKNWLYSKTIRVIIKGSGVDKAKGINFNDGETGLEILNKIKSEMRSELDLDTYDDDEIEIIYDGKVIGRTDVIATLVGDEKY
jgi:uncharacterized protein YacL